MLLLSLLLLAASLTAAEPRWSARWITAPDTPAFDYGVYHFRRAFDLASRPESFTIRVTADNRYQLFVNGERVAWGPARGDLYHWRYETIDIAPRLRPGRNVLAAVVWNFGELAPVAQTTHQTAFLLAGPGVDTGPEWKCARNPAYSPIAVTNRMVPGYYAAGPGERVDAAQYPWGWERPEFDDSRWVSARALTQGAPRGSSDSPNRWMLVARSIPPMEETPQRIARLRLAEGIRAPAGFPAQTAPFRVPASTKARLLLDQSFLTTGYPELVVSGGAGATVTLCYAESLYLPGNRGKGQRDQIEGKQMLGYSDAFVADGGTARLFRPLWWRTWRYIEMTVETRGEPLTIEDLRATYTGYPFERRARLDAGSPEIDRILDTGWRTARLCAHETYMDCPYYEQLQYVGDTRIQSLVSLYMTGDARLMRNAIEQLDSSRTAEGATYSRAPSRLQQYIPPFSLWWIGMVHDYWMYRDDPEFVRSMLPGVRAVLSFFAARQRDGASLHDVPWWNFIDWTRQWRGGVPPVDADGSSAPIDLQLLLGYQWAAEMEMALGSRGLAGDYRDAAARLVPAIQRLYWDPSHRMFADNPAKTRFSQHANSLALLAGLIDGRDARDLMERVSADTSLVQASIYFRYYLHSAMVKAGLGDRYLDMLGPWRGMLKNGLTTWAETEDPSRSDCHAWGASPNIEMFRTVLGIDTAAPGFRKVVIRPHLGSLERISGSMPHPKGELSVSLKMTNGKLEAEIALPPGVDGDFEWKGERKRLGPGKNALRF